MDKRPQKQSDRRNHVVARSGIGYPNGDLECKVRKGRISRSACVVQSYRQPEGRKGCPANL